MFSKCRLYLGHDAVFTVETDDSAMAGQACAFLLSSCVCVSFLREAGTVTLGK